VLCPECKTELEEGATSCHVCGWEMDETDWIMLGVIKNKFSADLAKETLSSQGIPAVVFSRSGFFGNAGLPLYPFFKKDDAMFEISVPVVFSEDAVEILDMTIGDNWHRKED